MLFRSNLASGSSTNVEASIKIGRSTSLDVPAVSVDELCANKAAAHPVMINLPLIIMFISTKKDTLLNRENYSNFDKFHFEDIYP